MFLFFRRSFLDSFSANVEALAIRYRRRQLDERVNGSKIIKQTYSAVADCLAATSVPGVLGALVPKKTVPA